MRTKNKYVIAPKHPPAAAPAAVAPVADFVPATKQPQVVQVKYRDNQFPSLSCFHILRTSSTHKVEPRFRFGIPPSPEGPFGTRHWSKFFNVIWRTEMRRVL